MKNNSINCIVGALIIQMTIIFSNLNAQSSWQVLFSKNPPSSPHTVYFEVLGLAEVPGSINYDLILARYKGWGLSARMGYGYSPIVQGEVFLDLYTDHILNGGFSLHHMWGRHGIEIGWGSSYNWSRYIDEPDIPLRFQFIYYSIGYRVQNPNGGLFFNANIYMMNTFYTPPTDSAPDWYPLTGIGIGYTFRKRKN